MLQPWQAGKVIRIEQETPNTRRYWIEAPGGEPFNFKPGQFVTLDLPIDEKPGKRWRSYSIASWPDGSPVFELVIVLLEDGRGTQYIFKEVMVGTELIFRGPLGNFVLPETIDKDLFLICTGTGVAPFRSMIHHILNHAIPHRHIYLIFGCRKTTDCLYGNELKMLEQELPDFSYLPTFSREEEGDTLLRKGYVHAVYEEICRGDCAYFYLCGWKNMIDEAKQRIIDMGYTRKDIHLELYG